MRLNITTTTKVVLFVDENGTIGKSEIKTDYANNYDYVVGADGQTWLLDQVHIIGYYENTQTESRKKCLTILKKYDIIII